MEDKAVKRGSNDDIEPDLEYYDEPREGIIVNDQGMVVEVFDL